MDLQLHSQPAPAPAHGEACSQRHPEGPRIDPEPNSREVMLTHRPPKAQSTSLNPRQKPLSRPATKVSYTRVTRNSEVTYTSTVYPVVTWPHTPDTRVATSCPSVFDTSYEPLTTTEEPSAPVTYSTIDGVTASKSDPTYHTNVFISCVEPASQDAVVPAKGWRQLTDNERKALLNCLNGGIAVWDIVSQFGVIARYIGVVNCAINAIFIWPLNSDMCKDLVGFAFGFGFSLPSLNGSDPISTHSRIPYLPFSGPGMTSPQCDPLCHYVYLMSDHQSLSTI
ncbi:hypothetical protein DSO57_1011799 [Entomophthora muscae]|uniref:Uncharacterized protein n=1 Tax=Entomophthora muscae TaxID=34485 RepID=A0ACC2UFY0_9FUNG|nr:hypothetical protein DSO57_1011799 [Entomophthora muscae]